MRKFNNKNIILSVVALLMIGVLAVGISFSWIEGGNKTYINSNEITITTGSNLTIRDHDGKITSELTFPVSDLYEVSSADGRSFFIPMDDNKTNAQASMTFRTGTPNDENKKYVSLDFQIEAGDSTTAVYLGSGTVVKCADPDINKALRMAFYENDGSAPIVFRPSQMPGVDNITYNPIVAIDNSGKILADGGTKETKTYAYGKYYYQGLGNSESIFDLSAGETKNITMVLWLEGTEITKDITDQSIDIKVEFTTNSNDLVNYNFVDNTHGFSDAKAEYWIPKTQENGNMKYDTMMYLYDLDGESYYAMVKSADYDTSRKWIVYVPKEITNFTFRRYSIDLDIYWNEWLPDMTKAIDGSTYVAICGKRNSNSDDWKENIGPCGGYWKDSNNTIRVFFEIKNSAGWGDPSCYVWTSNDSKPLGNHPGTTMTYSHTTSDAKIFFADISVTDGSEIHGIQFNNSNSENNKSAQLSFKNEYLGTEYFFNGFAAWYGNTGNTTEYSFDPEYNGNNRGTYECGAYIYQGVLNNPIWPSATIYCQGRYSTHYLYAYDDDNNNISAWHGNFMHKAFTENNVDYYRISIIIDNPYNVIVNNMNDKQYPENGSEIKLTVEPGKTYLLKNDSNGNTFTEYNP